MSTFALFSRVKHHFPCHCRLIGTCLVFANWRVWSKPARQSQVSCSDMVLYISNWLSWLINSMLSLCSHLGVRLKKRKRKEKSWPGGTTHVGLCSTNHWDITHLHHLLYFNLFFVLYVFQFEYDRTNKYALNPKKIYTYTGDINKQEQKNIPRMIKKKKTHRARVLVMETRGSNPKKQPVVPEEFCPMLQKWCKASSPT